MGVLLGITTNPFAEVIDRRAAGKVVSKHGYEGLVLESALVVNVLGSNDGAGGECKSRIEAIGVVSADGVHKES